MAPTLTPPRLGTGGGPVETLDAEGLDEVSDGDELMVLE